MENQNQRLFLIDGMALLFRSFYAMSRAGLTTPDGRPIGAVYGFLKIIFKILKEQAPSHFAVAWEPGGPNFRHEMYPLYKAHRKETPEEIKSQIPLIQELLREFGVPAFLANGFEGDDVIGTLARRFADEGGDVFIVSSDKDFMQLVDEHISIFSLKPGDNYQIVGREGVRDYFGVEPNRVVDVLALSGDSADNVPGVAGIGDKKAAALVNEFGNLDEILAKVSLIADKKKRAALEAGSNDALLSRQLVIIRTDVPIDVPLSSMHFSFDMLLASPVLRSRLQELRMSSLIRDVAAPARSAPLAAPLAPVNSAVSQSPNRLEMMTSIFGDFELPLQPVVGASNAEMDAHVGSAPAAISTAQWGRRDYKTVLTRSELEKLCSRIVSATDPFAFDTETTGLDVIEDRPIGASFSFVNGEAFFVPGHAALLQAGESGVAAEFSAAEVWEGLRLAFKNRKACAVAHNLKFDLHQLHNVGVLLGDAPIACSMVAAWLCNPVSGGFGLDAQTFKNFGLEKIPTSQLIGKESGRSSMLQVPLAMLSDYACEDADATLRLWNVYEKNMETSKVSGLFWEMEMPTLRLLASMEREGVHVDSTQLNALASEIRETIVMLESRICERSGKQFNISSPKQLGVVLFEVLKVHEICGFKGRLAKTSLGFKTDASVLEQFAEHEVVSLVLDYRELSKLMNTYIEVLPKLAKQSTGRIHTDFHQIGTATGRLSSSGPNLQNIPVRTKYGKKVRVAFTASAADRILTCADYSQIELRVLAHLAHDAAMIDAFSKGQDIHRETAAKIHGKALADVTSEERSAAKAINFGIIYGMGAQRLAKQQGIPLAQAKLFIEKYFENFPGIRKFINEQRAFAHAHGFVSTFFGRIRPIPELNNPNMMVARSAENIAINSPVQGTAADIMKLGMLRVERALRAGNFVTKMLLQVHDEIVLEGPRSEAEAVKKIVHDALEGAVNFDVPLAAEVGQGANWLDAK